MFNRCAFALGMAVFASTALTVITLKQHPAPTLNLCAEISIDNFTKDEISSLEITQGDLSIRLRKILEGERRLLRFYPSNSTQYSLDSMVYVETTEFHGYKIKHDFEAGKKYSLELYEDRMETWPN